MCKGQTTESRALGPNGSVLFQIIYTTFLLLVFRIILTLKTQMNTFEDIMRQG